MKHAYFYVLFFVTTCSLRSMETSEIRVKNLKLDIKIAINDQTTVEDVKKELLNFEGIPVNQQALHVVTQKWLSEKINPAALPNDANIKNVMHTNNTNVFQLYLQLRPRS